MQGFWQNWFQARRVEKARKNKRSAGLEVERLEERCTMTWGAVPPAYIAPAAMTANANTIHVNNYGDTRNYRGDVTGGASITASEVDFYRLVAPTSGNYGWVGRSALQIGLG